MSTKLKKCPFCGARATVNIGQHDFDDVEVICTECGATGGCFNAEGCSAVENRQAAIAHWNTRYDL